MKKIKFILLTTIILNSLLFSASYKVKKNKSENVWQFSQGNISGDAVLDRIPLDAGEIKPLFINISFEASSSDFEIIAKRKKYFNVQSDIHPE